MAGAGGHLVAAAALCWAIVACSEDAPSEAPSATVAAGRSTTSVITTSTAAATTSTPTTESPQLTGAEREVEAAYLHSWDIYADAMLRLDPTRLEEAYSGPALDARRRQVENLARLNTPARMQVEHDYEVVVLNADDALILETYVNHSVYLDRETMQPIEPDPNEVVQREYVLRRESAGWRVAHINAVS